MNSELEVLYDAVARLERDKVAYMLTGTSMQDTTPEFQRMVDEHYRRMPPAERVRVAMEMFDTARMLVEASMPPGLDPLERKIRVAERFYGPLARLALTKA